MLVGKKSTIGGIDVARATYERNADGTGARINVLAGSREAQDIIVRDGDDGGGPGRLIPSTPLRSDGVRYAARVAAPGALPASVDVVNRSDVPQTVKHVRLTDAVTATAVYHMTRAGGDVLHVSASSSDRTLTGADLTLPQFAGQALGATGQVDVATDAPPDKVRVNSSKGGSVTVPVTMDGENLDALPLVAAAGPDVSVDQGATVTLDGTGSSGDIDSCHWTAPAGVTLTGADTAKAFTAPASQTPPTFQLTVSGNGQTTTDDVVVTVKPLVPARAVIAPVGGDVLQNLPLTLDASGSDGAARFEWPQVSGTPVTLNNKTKPTLTFLFPKTTTPIVMQVRVRRFDDTTPAGGACAAPVCDSAQITLTPALDDLANIRARFDPSKARWTVDGTATILEANNVRVHAGATLSGPVVGTALVDPTGAWKIDVRGSTVGAPACRCVSVESDRGGVALNVPME